MTSAASPSKSSTIAPSSRPPMPARARGVPDQVGEAHRQLPPVDRTGAGEEQPLGVGRQVPAPDVVLQLAHQRQQLLGGAHARRHRRRCPRRPAPRRACRSASRPAGTATGPSPGRWTPPPRLDEPRVDQRREPGQRTDVGVGEGRVVVRDVGEAQRAPQLPGALAGHPGQLGDLRAGVPAGPVEQQPLEGLAGIGAARLGGPGNGHGRQVSPWCARRARRTPSDGWRRPAPSRAAGP